MCRAGHSFWKKDITANDKAGPEKPLPKKSHNQWCYFSRSACWNHTRSSENANAWDTPPEILISLAQDVAWALGFLEVPQIIPNVQSSLRYTVLAKLLSAKAQVKWITMVLTLW